MFWYQIGSRGVSGRVGITYGEWETAAEEKYSAFTVAELGEILSETLDLNGPFGWDLFRENSKWRCIARYFADASQEAETEAEARARLVLYLLENRLLGTY